MMTRNSEGKSWSEMSRKIDILDDPCGNPILSFKLFACIMIYMEIVESCSQKREVFLSHHSQILIPTVFFLPGPQLRSQ